MDTGFLIGMAAAIVCGIVFVSACGYDPWPFKAGKNEPAPVGEKPSPPPEPVSAMQLQTKLLQDMVGLGLPPLAKITSITHGPGPDEEGLTIEWTYPIDPQSPQAIRPEPPIPPRPPRPKKGRWLDKSLLR